MDTPVFMSITRTARELSVVCPESAAPHGVAVERGWRLLEIHGPLAFGQIGVLAGFLSPLAAAGVSVFVVSTFDTDYVLVKETHVAAACAALTAAGHALVEKPA